MPPGSVVPDELWVGLIPHPECFPTTPAHPRCVCVGIALQLSSEEVLPLLLLFWGENPVGAMGAREANSSPAEDALPAPRLGAGSEEVAL